MFNSRFLLSLQPHGDLMLLPVSAFRAWRDLRAERRALTEAELSQMSNAECLALSCAEALMFLTCIGGAIGAIGGLTLIFLLVRR